MKMYNAPTIEAVELNAVDVIATSGEIGDNTGSYGLKATAADNTTAITYTDKGQAWQSNWN
ncbi:MAG: hypothetical protein IKV89_03005 [Clostridia bacterium]|nr:hypothetical protein [Clostridia bacterium]